MLKRIGKKCVYIFINIGMWIISNVDLFVLLYLQFGRIAFILFTHICHAFYNLLCLLTYINLEQGKLSIQEENFELSLKENCVHKHNK